MSTSSEAKQAAFDEYWKTRGEGVYRADVFRVVFDAGYDAATAKSETRCGELREELVAAKDTFMRIRDLCGAKDTDSRSCEQIVQDQLAHQQPSPPSEYGPKLPWPRGGYGATTPNVEKWIQEIKDLFARYGSGDYTPTEHEKAVIERGLYKVLTDALAQARAPLVAALRLGLALEEKGNIWSVNPGKFQAFLKAGRAALIGTE